MNSRKIKGVGISIVVLLMVSISLPSISAYPTEAFDIQVEKSVKENCDGVWSDTGVTIDLGDPGASDWVTFRIVVENTGDVPLDVVVRDVLPVGLVYGDFATPREPDSVSGREYTWYFDDVAVGGEVVVSFRAYKGECNVKYVNWVYVTGSYGCEVVVSDDDCAFVKWLCSCVQPGIEVVKSVKENCDGVWSDTGVTIDLGDPGASDWVTFRIVVENTGDVPLDVVVRDVLPVGLVYGDFATPREPDSVSGREYTWYFNDVSARTSFTISFRAYISENDICGSNMLVNNVYVTGSYSCQQTVSDEDSAYVHIQEYTLVALPGGPYLGYAGQSIKIVGSAKGGTSPYTYKWDLDNNGYYNDANGQTIYKSWQKEGYYTIGLQVTDANAHVATAKTTVTIKCPPNDPPKTPDLPDDTRHAETGDVQEFSVQTDDPNNDDIRYGWDWNGDDTIDEWTAYAPSGVTTSINHGWMTAGSYSVRVQAEDEKGARSDFSEAMTVVISDHVNNPPGRPTTPQGTTTGKTGTTYQFTSSATDPEQDLLYYCFDWGDGTENGGWIGPYPSGATVVDYHTYTVAGDYQVKIKAIDDPNGDGFLDDGSESGWSNALTVSISKEKTNIFLQLLNYLLERFPFLARILPNL